MTEQGCRRRLIFLATLLLACFLGLSVRVALLHAGIYSESIAGLIATGKIERDLNVERGRVLDCNGNLLAVDLSRKEVIADPSVIHSNSAVESVSAFMATCFGVDRSAMAARLSDPKRRFAYLGGYGTYIDLELADRIKERRFPGISLVDVYVRSYPRGSSMCHVLGHVNLERQGSSGIEQEWNEQVRGVRGLMVSELNGRGGEMYRSRSIDIKPRRGADVILTLDQSVQYIVEQALAKAVEQQDASAAWAIVQRVKTGEILAMASVPAFDPNEFRDVAPDQMRNCCIANIYEPGSTFKIAVVAAALDAGVVVPDDVFDCENGVWIYERRPLRDFHPYGELSVADIIKKSSNIGAAKIALRLGEPKLHSYLKSFGIGRKTGVGLPGEEAGILRPVSDWTRLSITRIAMGHEVAVTALQMLGAMNAIANGGALMKPYVVSKVVSPDGNILFENTPQIMSRPITPRTAATLRGLLARVTEEGGTGRSARVEKYKVCGKTGTSQKAIAGGYSDFLNIASFAGFLPAEDPELCIIVVLDEPKKSVRTGGAVSGPVFKEIAEQAVRYLQIPPVPSEPSFAKRGEARQ